MTFEEFKAEAKRQGYNLIKRYERVPLKKCSCGASRSIRCFYSVYGDRYRCIKCGLEGKPANTLKRGGVKQARLNWNKAVEESEKSQ